MDTEITVGAIREVSFRGFLPERSEGYSIRPLQLAQCRTWTNQEERVSILAGFSVCGRLGSISLLVLG